MMSETKTKTKKTRRKVKAQVDQMKAFEQGVGLLYKKRWSAAQKVFAGIAETQPGSAVAERSRRFQDLCVARSNEDEDSGDNYLNAVYQKNAGDLDAAIEYCNRGGLKGRDERFAYLAAAIEGLRENHEEAAKLLERAIEMNPVNRVHAFHDPDFLSLRSDPDFAEIFSSD